MLKMYDYISQKMHVFEQLKRAPSIYAVVSSVFFVSVGISIKKLHAIPPSQILFFRSVICYTMNFMLMKISQTSTYPTSQKLHFIIMIRCLVGTLAHFCYYLAISMMNLSDAIAIFLTTPIVTTILATLFLRETLQKSILLSIFTSFAGILLIVKPPFIFDAIGLTSNDASYDLSSTGLLVCVAFAVFESLTNIVIKSIGKQISVLAVIQYVYVAGYLFNGTLIVIRNDFNIEIYTAHNFTWIFILSILNFLAQLIYNRALQLGTTSQVVPFTYSQVVLSFLVDVILFSKEINILSLFGALMIVAGNYTIIIATQK